VIHAEVLAEVPVQRISVELNGNAVSAPPWEPSERGTIEVPVRLRLGKNLIYLRAETERSRTSLLGTVTYDGGDDRLSPWLRVVRPASGGQSTTDSTVVVEGYAYDDVKVVEVTVEGRPSRPWGGGSASEGTKDLVVEALVEAGDSLAFRSVVLPLSVGLNRLRVEARDLKGRTVREEIRLFREPAFTGDRWAVVVGVSDYQSGVQSLQYADDDARAFYEFLRSPRGGGFDPEKMRLLLNEQATSQALRHALFVFLRQASKDDLVIIYFSGHGASEPGRPDLVYLLTHDAEPEMLASTAFAMHDITTALQLHIPAQRVLIVADACHSGAVMSLPTQVAMRSGEEEKELVYRYLQELSESAPGRGVFTASEAREQSREGAQWGGGHGVFTYHLLEGLGGKADVDANGVVTLGEVIEYTRRRVEEDTAGRQHPDPGGDFDRNLPMAVRRVE